MGTLNSDALLYMCNWGKNRSLTWSGTSLSLQRALEKKFRVIEGNVAPNVIEKCLIKLTNVQFNSGKITFNAPIYCNFLYEKIMMHNMMQIANRYNNPVFEIGCIGACKQCFYTYQDVCIEALIDLRKNNPIAFQYSTVQNIPLKQLRRKSKFQREVYQSAEVIFTMGKWVADYMTHQMGIPKEKILAVGGGTNIDVTKVDFSRKTGNKFLFVGRDFYRKGGDLVCNAFNIVQRRYREDVILYVAGPSSIPKECRCNPNIHYIGDLCYEELSEYFNICDVFCMPSRYEAYGLVFCEALIYGMPIIARNAFEMKYFVDNMINGYLVNDDDCEILAKAMFDSINNKEMISYVKNNHSKYAKEYSWDTVASRISEKIQNGKGEFN